MKPMKKMISTFVRRKSWDMGIIFGTKVTRQQAEYLYDFKGLKLFGFYEPDGMYNISEACSGYLIIRGENREDLIEKSKNILAQAADNQILTIRKMAKYYGISAMHTSTCHIVRDNTLANWKEKKKYINRIGNIRCKDCGCLYEKCIERTNKGEIRACCPDCHCGTRRKNIEN